MVSDPHTRRSGEVSTFQVVSPTPGVNPFFSVEQILGRIFVAITVILFVAPSVSFGQNWNGVLSPSRAIDWSQAGIAGGIPTRTRVCATMNPGGTVSHINNAI